MENAAKRKAKRKLKHTKAKQYRKFMAASASVTEASEPKSFEAERRRRRNRNTENRNTKINNKTPLPSARLNSLENPDRRGPEKGENGQRGIGKPNSNICHQSKPAPFQLQLQFARRNQHSWQESQSHAEFACQAALLPHNAAAFSQSQCIPHFGAGLFHKTSKNPLKRYLKAFKLKLKSLSLYLINIFNSLTNV